MGIPVADTSEQDDHLDEVDELDESTDAESVDADDGEGDAVADDEGELDSAEAELCASREDMEDVSCPWTTECS